MTTQPRSRVYSASATEPTQNLRLSIVSGSTFQPLGFFVWGCSEETIIRDMRVGVRPVPWVLGRKAVLFTPALPHGLVEGFARLDPAFTADGWQPEHYQAFPVAEPGMVLVVEFQGFAKEIAFWGLERRRA